SRRGRSSAGEARWSLLRERLQPFSRVLRREAVLVVALALVAEPFGLGTVVGPHRLQDLLGVGEAERALRRDLARELEPDGFERGVVDDPVPHTPVRRTAAHQT